MKPAPGIQLSRVNVAEIYGGEVKPLATLAAKTNAARAEHFKFTDEDEALLQAVLGQNGAHGDTGHSGAGDQAPDTPDGSLAEQR